MAAQHNQQHTAIIGGGWAGMAAAVAAAQAGQQVTVLEAARTLGGRARAVEEHHPAPGQPPLRLDNGQHILIGAYSACLQLMRLVGVDVDRALLRRPLALSFPDGTGLALPDLPAPWDALLGILRTRGWSLPDKLGLLRTATQWQLGGFACAPGQTVAQLCAGLTPRLQAEFIEPLCVSALNTPAQAACGQVFLRVLKDAMFGQRGGSNLLLPQVDLSALFPDAAARWLRERGHTVHTGQRVQHLRARPGAPTGWQLDAGGHQLHVDRLIIATPAHEAARLLIEAARSLDSAAAAALQAWAVGALALQHEAITTVYAQAGADTRLARPMLALHCDGSQPAQFVFDRGQLGGPAGLLAFVISASHGTRDSLQQRVQRQAEAQLGLDVQVVQTITEKRATFACTPNLSRPAMQPLPGWPLALCGDYIAGPYPATLEGAVRSGWAAGQA